jgi:acetoin utilization protein AcuB
MLTASQLMTENPVTVLETARLGQALQTLQTMEIRHLPVVNREGELVGMLSDRDLRGLSIPYLLGEEDAGRVQAARDAPVVDLMSSDVLTVNPETDAAEIVEMMLDNKIGAVPVVEEDGALVGIVSYVDVLRNLPLDAD